MAHSHPTVGKRHRDSLKMHTNSTSAGLVQVGTGAKLKDSNMANYGSKMHKDFIRSIAAIEMDYAGAGNKTGVEIWRVENKKRTHLGKADFGINRWPREKYGQFYSGDSFIVLRTYHKKKDEDLHHTIYFWLGKGSSIDERGVAAYKTFELDENLGGEPKQVRVMEGNEPDQFLKCFEHPIRVLAGGIASGFSHVKPESFQPRLFHVKGKGSKVRCYQIEFSAKAMNDGDVFILDKGLIQIQYNGRSAGGFERNKGKEILQEIRSSRQRGTAKVRQPIIMDDDDCAEFWTTLEGSPSDVKSASDGGSDAAASKKAPEVTKMYKVSNATGKMEYTLVKQGKLSFADLDTNEVFVIDTDEEIFVWVGNKASKDEKKDAMLYAEMYLATDEGPYEQCTVTRILEKDRDPPLAFDRAFK